MKIGPDYSKMSRIEIAKTKLYEGKNVVEICAEDVMFYIYDEAHYFINDAAFNSKTNFWNDDSRFSQISIFITATPEPLFCCFARKNYASEESLKELYDNLQEKEKFWEELSAVNEAICRDNDGKVKIQCKYYTSASIIQMMRSEVNVVK